MEVNNFEGNRGIYFGNGKRSKKILEGLSGGANLFRSGRFGRAIDYFVGAGIFGGAEFWRSPREFWRSR